MPTLQEVTIAKNYLLEEELKILNNIVSGYFDFAEVQAMRRQHMRMQDYIDHLDALLAGTGEEVLLGAGQVSNKQAAEKATAEYRKYQNKTLSSVESAYLDSLKVIQKQIGTRSQGVEEA
jgi:hypothetical protein